MISVASLKKVLREPLYRNSFFIIMNTGLGALFGMLFWIVAAHAMPSDQVGLITAVTSVGTFIITISRLGLDAGLVRFLPTSEDKNALYNGTMIISVIVALAITAVFLAGLDFFSPALGFLREWQYLVVFVAYVVIYLVYFLQNTTLMAMRRADLYFYQNLIVGGRVPLLFFLYFLFPGVMGAILIMDVSFLAAFVFGRLMLARSGFAFSLKVDWRKIREIFRFSIGNYTANIFALAPISFIPVIIINTVGAAGNAYFFIAYSVASIMTMIPSAVAASLFVEGSHNMPLGEITAKSARMVAVLIVPAFLITFLFGDRLLMLFSQEYSDQAFEVLRLLAISSLFTTVTTLYISIKKIQKDIGIVNVINSAISLLVIATGYVFLQAFGLIGIGYAWLLTNVIICAVILGLIVWRDQWVLLAGADGKLINLKLR